MGKKHSKPEYIDVYAPPDPLFIDLGCLGLLRYEYSEQNRMGSAPFHTETFKANSYQEMFTKVLVHLEKVAKLQVPIADSLPLIQGPVFLFAAYDFEINNIECWLHFPNLNKKTKTLYQTNYERGVYNRWMHRLITHSMYKMNPSPACNWHMKYNRSKLPVDQQSTEPAVEPVMPSSSRGTKYVRVPSEQGETNTFMFGCRSTESARCLQSNSIHKKMGIYEDDKKPFHYPNIYFHVYRIDSSDPRVSAFIDQKSATTLVRNILPAGLDMNVGCLNSLISENNMYSFALGNRRFGIYRNRDLKACSNNRDAIYERKFYGYLNTRMVIEDSVLMVYSQPGEGSSEQLVFSMRIAPQNAELPLALVLEDDGSVRVYDRKDNPSELISSDGNLNSNVSGGSGTEYNMLEDNMGFDTIAEYKRRLENLHAYLRSINLFVQSSTGIDLSAANVPVPAQVMEDLPPYDPDMDYVFRWNEWLNYLVAHHSVTKSDILPYYINTATRGIAQQQAYKARIEQERVRNAEQQLDEQDQADMIDDSAAVQELSPDDADALEEATDEAIKAKAAATEEREEDMKGIGYGMADYDPTTQPRQQLPPIPPENNTQSTPFARQNIQKEVRESEAQAAAFGVSLASITPQPTQYQAPIHSDMFDTVLDNKQRLRAIGL